MNEYRVSDALELRHFKNVIDNGDYETVREMLDGKCEVIFEACQDVAQEIKSLSGFKIKSPTDIEKLCLNEKGLRLMVSLLELITNDGVMLTCSQLNNQEEK